MTPNDPNSALVWLPAITAAGLPVPRTEIVPFRPAGLWPMLDGENISEDFPYNDLVEACKRIGYPVFLRTDLASAKHDGPKAYKASRELELSRCLFSTFEDNALKGLADAARAFLVREFIDIPCVFEAFGGLPIGREWRFFADQDGVRCRHFCWPDKAFECNPYLPANWKQLLSETEHRTDAMEELSAMALQAAQAVGHGAWSIDFAQDAMGKWWLIDMATAANSWHPEHP